MTAEEALARIVEETLAKRECIRQSQVHDAGRAAAVRAYRADTGRTKVRIAEDVRAALIRAGVPEAEVKGLGVSHDSIRNILEREGSHERQAEDAGDDGGAGEDSHHSNVRGGDDRPP